MATLRNKAHKKQTIMKYLLFLIALFATATAHSQCSEFDGLLQKGDNYLKGNKPNYQEAINAYTAAILACSGRAGEAKQRITRMVNEINKLREKATEAQRNAETALANLEKANASTVALLLENADRDILNLRYEDALQKIKAAAGLGSLKPEVAKAYLEIAFWYGETGNTQRAGGILDSAGLLVNKKIDSSLPPRKAIEAFDPGTYTKLMERYYPVIVQVEGGIFDMGCDPGDQCEDLHKQEVSSFQMAKYETTWWQYYLFCKATGHEYESPGWGTEGDNPAVHVNWYDAVEYCNWVSRQLGKTEAIIKKEDEEYAMKEYAMNLSGGYRLPTEAEWEYAAKGGNRPDKTIYSGSNDLDLVGWSRDNSGGRTRAVGKKKANALGLYDISGNVWEWCWDWYSYYTDSEKDYKGPDYTERRVIRGGGWDYPELFAGSVNCRTANRGRLNPDQGDYSIGFRLVFVP